MKRILLIHIILVTFLQSVESQVRIKMQNDGGVYTTPCIVNGLKLRFIFDTGASNVSLSLSEAIFMLKNGYLEEKDIHGSSYTQIANGDIIENTTVNLREIEIGGIKIYNVEAVIIHELSAPLLLGQSAIQKLGIIQIDDNQLVIMNSNSSNSLESCQKAKKKLIESEAHYFNELYALSTKTYQEAYDLCPNEFDCKQLDFMASSYFKCEDYLTAIKYLEQVSNCLKNNDYLFYCHINLGTAYLKTKNTESAIINFQKALTFATNNDEFYTHCYYNMGKVYYEQEKFHQAIKYYDKAEFHILKNLSTTVNEVMKGKVKSYILGELYLELAASYLKLKLHSKSDNYMIKSALCGLKQSIEFCNKYDLKYELYMNDD